MRTNKYFVTGLTVSNLALAGKDPQPSMFNLTVTIAGIANDTPAENIMQAVVEDVKRELEEKKVVYSTMLIQNCGLIDTFEDRPQFKPVQQNPKRKLAEKITPDK